MYEWVGGGMRSTELSQYQSKYFFIFFFLPHCSAPAVKSGVRGFFDEPLIICAPSHKVLTNALLLRCIWKFSKKNKKSMRRKYWRSSDENASTGCVQSTQAPLSRCQSAVAADVSSPVTQKAFNTIDTAEPFNITPVRKTISFTNFCKHKTRIKEKKG